MKSAKTEFKYLPFFDNNNTHFQLQSKKKYHHNANPPPAFVQTDGGSTIAKKKCQRHPLRILRPVATLAVSMTLFNHN